MRTRFLPAFLASSVLALSGCSASFERPAGGAFTGGVVGGVAGAVCCGNPTKDAGIGAVIGIVVGALIGFAIDQYQPID